MFELVYPQTISATKKKNMWQPLQNHAHQHIESSYELNLEYCLLRFWSGTTSTLTDPDKKAYLSHYPRCSMYGMLSYIYTIHVPNVGTYSIHGAYGTLKLARPMQAGREFR